MTKLSDVQELALSLKDNLPKFAKVICPNLITGKIPEFHKEIYNLCINNERLVLAAPRGFAKSTIVARIYPLYLSLFCRRKDICIISASESLAIEHLRYIKTEIEANPFINAVWGDLKSDKWTENHIMIRHRNGKVVNLRAKGAGAQIRGFRPDCLILDDIETDESVESEDQRKKLKDWLFRACLNTLLPGGQMLLIGTVIHPLSVLNDLLDSDNGWVRKRFKAYIDGVEDKGHELWGDCRPHEWLQQRKKEIGTSAFSSEYMNDPLSDENAPIKSDQIRYFDKCPEDCNFVMVVDPAYSEEEKSDFKVASVIGLDMRHNRYLDYVIRTHAPSGEFIDSFLNLYLRYQGRITALGVPDSGTEKEFYNSVVKKITERGLAIALVPLKNQTITATNRTIRRKKDRIVAALQPIFEQGRYFIRKEHTFALDELLGLGFTRNDDVVDTMCYAEQILAPNFYNINTPTRDRYGDLTTYRSEGYQEYWE